MATIIRKAKALNNVITGSKPVASSIPATNPVKSTAGYTAAAAAQQYTNPRVSTDGQVINDLGNTGDYGYNPDGSLKESTNSPTTRQETGTPSSSSSSSSSSSTTTGVKPVFAESARTTDYYDTLSDLEGEKPAAFNSKYTAAIDSLLNTIQNPTKFSLANDDTYNQLYNQYKESYMNQGNRAMRDTQGSAAALTGGYGNTYAETAGSQAYDNYLSQLNDKNQSLAQMALDDYWKNRSDKYNQLSAVQSADNTDYSRYRDTVGDWQNDRSYYAGQAQNSYGNDYNLYNSALNQYNTETAAESAASQFAEQMAIKKAEDDQAQKNWQTQWDYQLAQDALKQAQAASGSSGGSSGGSGRRSSGGSSRKKSSSSGKSLSTTQSTSNWAQFANSLARGMTNGRISNQSAAEQIANRVADGTYTEDEMDKIIDASGVNWSLAQRVHNAKANAKTTSR